MNTNDVAEWNSDNTITLVRIDSVRGDTIRASYIFAPETTGESSTASRLIRIKRPISEFRVLWTAKVLKEEANRERTQDTDPKILSHGFELIRAGHTIREAAIIAGIAESTLCRQRILKGVFGPRGRRCEKPKEVSL